VRCSQGPLDKFGKRPIKKIPKKTYKDQDGISVIVSSPLSNTCDIRFVIKPLVAFMGKNDMISYHVRGKSIVQFIKPGQLLEFKFNDTHDDKFTIGIDVDEGYHLGYCCYGIFLHLNEN
jgi:hypothetical protein